MKKSLNYVLYGLTGFLLFSCRTAKPVVYSCDKTINEWVIENLDHIRTLKRSQWNYLDEGKKRAAYVSFTPEQKIAMWEGKCEQILTLDWSEKEREHIYTFRKFIDSHHEYFHGSKLSKSQNRKLEAFASAWSEKAEQELGWSKKLIYSIIASPNNLLDKQGNIETVTEN